MDIDDWEGENPPMGKGKGKSKKIPLEKGSVSTSEKGLNALKEIMSDMTSMTRQVNQWSRRKENPLTGMKGVSFKINTIYVDDGSEFYGAFERFCKEKDVDVVHFSPSTGTKRRMGLVERFNRTLKRYIQVFWAKQMKLHGYHDSLVNTLPKVLTHNMEKRQRGVAGDYRRQTGAKRVGFKVTPFGMHAPGLEMKQHVPFKVRDTAEVDEYYKDRIADFNRPLYQRPTVRYFLKINSTDLRKKGDKFQRRGMGNLSTKQYIGPHHAYKIPLKKYEVGKRAAGLRMGKSYAVGPKVGIHSNFRVLPYDVIYA